MSHPPNSLTVSLAQFAETHLPHRHDHFLPSIVPWHTVQVWIGRHRQRRALAELARLNDHLLRDIGISQEDALREAAKPFWR